MNRITADKCNRTILLAIAICALILDSPATLNAAEKQKLFDGQSLKGWSGNKEIWSVKDGQIVGTTVGNKIKANTFLVWQGGEVEDFRLTYHAKLEGKNNSGVQYRSKLVDPKTWKVAGYQADMHPKPEYVAMLYSEGTGRGIVAQRSQKVVVHEETGKPEVVGETSKATAIDISKWHEYTIIARGNHLIHMVDGKVAVDIIDNHKKKLVRGILALQVHAGPPMTVFFKDIVLESYPKREAGKAKETIPPVKKKLSGTTPAEITSSAAGFQVEKVFEVPKSMGSWVSLAVDDLGRLIASDQGDKGLYLITPSKPGAGDSTQVSKLPVELSGAQGLLWAFDSLYAMVSGGSASGLHRLTDTTGDGLVDTDKHLLSVPGRGEHGPHGIVLSPDGKSLYVSCGNHTDLPKSVVASRNPMNWGEDLLLPRRWDARGHAQGRLAPGGWICKLDPNGENWEVVSSGYRNQYDIAFNADGELFAYDADMEWDFGMPWYRPTRVSHATSGSEFGWRSGTGKWPAYYEDSLPAAVDIGPGSPTGVIFGYGAQFPAKYQKALFILDWTFGTIYAIHFTPEGASYRGEKEEFITGLPLAVTDAVIGADGALYFTVGGRGTQSALYRVTYAGDAPTTPVAYREPAGAELRSLRHRLEAMHGSGEGDLDFLFANLGHADRFVRYAARIALESQPVDGWRDRALSVSDPRAAITAMMALARQGEASDHESAVQALGQIDLAKLDESAQLALLRAYSLAFIRLGEPTAETRERLIAKWSPLYPTATVAKHLDLELVQMLVYLRDPSVVAKTLALMDRLGPDPVPNWVELSKRSGQYGGTIQRMMDNMPPTRAIHFAFVLRNVQQDWTLEERKKYLAFFQKAAKHSGGKSYTGFLEHVRDDALATCSPAERVLLEPLVNQSLAAKPIKVTPPQGPGRKWTKAEAIALVGDKMKKRDHGDGRNLFHAVSCAKCHRFNGEGGAIGPDLTTAARKYSLADLLDSILEPSKVISDQYESHLVQTVDGLVVSGRVVEVGDEILVFTDDPDAPPQVIKSSDVEEMAISPVSQMPANLVDGLNRRELKDLLAYLMSGSK